MNARAALVILAMMTPLTLLASSPSAAATGCIGMGQTNAQHQQSCVGWAYQTPDGGGGCIGLYDESQSDHCDGIDP